MNNSCNKSNWSDVCFLIFCYYLRQVRELAEKEAENGVFKMLRSDVTRFLTTILIGTTYCVLILCLVFQSC